MFDVCATGDTAHIDTIFRFLTFVNPMCSWIKLDVFDWKNLHFVYIQVLATHASTWVHRYSSLLPLGQRGHVGGSFAYFVRNARCTVTTELLVRYCNTQNDFSPGAAIFSLHTLASPSGRNVNYDEKQLTGKKNFELFLLSVQVL